jgi:hypothetical protein
MYLMIRTKLSYGCKMIHGQDWRLKRLKGHPQPSLLALAYSHRFCEKKYAKPDYDGYLQVPATAARAINAALTGR